jgi:hypothetical protein
VRNPRTASRKPLGLVGDLARPDRYVEVRGKFVAFELYDSLDSVNQLARKYTDADFSGGADGEHRYRATFRIDAWTGQG